MIYHWKPGYTNALFVMLVMATLLYICTSIEYKLPREYYGTNHHEINYTRHVLSTNYQEENTTVQTTTR